MSDEKWGRWNLSEMRGCGPDCERLEIPVEYRTSNHNHMEAQHVLSRGVFMKKTKNVLDKMYALTAESWDFEGAELREELDDLTCRRARTIVYQKQGRIQVEDG